MATQGWHLQKCILGYFTFVKGEPGKYIYRNEWIHKKKLKLLSVFRVDEY